MTSHAIATPRWSTSSFGSAGGKATVDHSGLREHLSLCRGARGRWFALQCAVDAMNSYIVGHFVTTLAVAALVIGTAALLA